MASKASICNAALAILGENGIGDPDSDTSPQAISLNAVYGQHRDSVLAMAYWPFARERRVISKSASAPAFGYSAQYDLPPNWITVMKGNVWSDADGSKITDYELEEGTNGLALLCNGPTKIRLRGIKSGVPEGRFHPLFSDLLSAFLAMRQARQIVGDDERRIQMAKTEFRETLPQAIAFANRDIPIAAVIEDDIWAEARQ